MEPMALGHLAVWRHTPKSSPKARILLIHGICEHSGRYLPMIDALTSQGFEVVRFDLRGSGMSGGRRQHVESFADYVADVAAVHNWIAGELDTLPLFVMGHSMGGAIAIYFTSEYGGLFQGMILSAPGYKAGGISPWLIRAGRLASHVAPTFRLYQSKPEALSRDPEVVEAYRTDPLASRFNTLQQGKAVLDAFEKLPERCAKIGNPALIYHGTSDRVVLPSGSFELMRALGSTDKELHYLPGGYHEPHLDIEKEKCFSLVCRWLEDHLPSAQKATKPSKSKGQTVSQVEAS